MFFTILCYPANGAGYIIQTLSMRDSLEIIYAKFQIFARNRPSMVTKRNVKTKRNKERQSELNTKNLELINIF